MTTTFTADMIPAGACLRQVDLFRETFPNGAPMAVEAAVSVAEKFQWDWIARRTLKGRYLKDYDFKWSQICEAYGAKLAAVGSHYKAARTPIYADYKAKMATLFAELYIAQVSQ